LGAKCADEANASVQGLLTASATACEVLTAHEVVLVVPEGHHAASQPIEGCSKIRIIRARPDATWAEACSLGLASVTGELIAVLDSGCQIEPDWLAVLSSFLDRHADAGAVEGVCAFDDEGQTSPVSSSGASSLGHIEVDPTALTWKVISDGVARTREVACLSPQAFLLRRSALEALASPPLDHRFRTEWAAYDMFARLIERRWRLYHVVAAKARCQRHSTGCHSGDTHSVHRRELLLFAWKHLAQRERDYHIAVTARQARQGLRGLMSRPSPAESAAREALAWVRAQEPGLAAERASSGIAEGAFADAAQAAQSRASYSFHVRQEIIDLIPAEAKDVLDIGCAAGVLGAALKRQRPGVRVRGVEISSEAAKLALEVLDDVHCGSAEDVLPAAWPRPDCVIFADVLEHLRDPWAVCRRYRGMLGPGGTVVLSLPNIGHRAVVTSLLRGRFDYVDAGILDRTHLRFFTRSSAVELLQSCGFRVDRVLSKMDRPTEPWLRIARLIMPSAFLRDLHTVQFILVGTAV
ncbi:MAG: methyltransferase domain-containing protein, partial [Polyangia bacterium]